MRSILLQTRRTSSRSLLLLLPRLSSSSSPLPRRSNATLPSSVPPSIPTPSEGSSSSPSPSLLQPSSNSSSSSQSPLTSRDPPPPLRILSTSTSPTEPAASPLKEAPKPHWFIQIQVDNHRGKAAVLAEHLEGEGSEGVVGRPEVVKTARRILRDVPHLSNVTDDHLRSIFIIYRAISTSPTAENDYGREWIRSTLVRLLLLFTRRSNPKSEVLVSSLQLLVQAASKQEDIKIHRELYRTIIVDLASGATNASEAVDIVEGLRRLSPSSFTESELEEVLQAIGRVEDWTTTTRDTFELPSFPTPIKPLALPPLPASSSSSDLTNTPITSLNHAQLPSSPSSSSSSKDTTAQPPSSPPPSSSSPIHPQSLLEFTRILNTAPPPSFADIASLTNLFDKTYHDPRTIRSIETVFLETLLRLLAFANRAPPQAGSSQIRFAGLISTLVARLADFLSNYKFSSFGIDVQKEIFPLVKRLDTQGRVRAFARAFYYLRTEEYGEEELGILKKALNSLPPDVSRRNPATPTFVDWENGFGSRLSDLIQSSASSSNNNVADREWLDQALPALVDPRVGTGRAYGLLGRGALDAPSTLETLVVASKLYSKFASPSRLPVIWRQHGEVIVRMLLLFSNYQGDTPPPFQLLAPALLDLHHLPPSFIPPTSSIPSFAIPLLPLTKTPEESLLVVNSLLHAQQAQPAVLLEIWSTFLSSLENHSSIPSPTQMVSSRLFKAVTQSSESLEDGPALEDLILMHLRRWRRAEEEGGNVQGEEMALETLGRFVEGRVMVRERVYGASLFATLMEVQVAVRQDWREVFRIWEEVQEEVGVDSKSVEMYLLACLETSSFDQAKTLFTTIQAYPSMLPLLTPRNWSLYYSILVKSKDLPSLVETFQASLKEEDASPLAVEDLAKAIELAREVGGDEGKTAEEKLVDLAGKERFEEAVGRLGGKNKGEQGTVDEAEIL